MTEQQTKLYALLKEIDAICRKHGIVYYLAGGTCIGAIRHRGFLPWDDDMDLYMTRDNWEKFIEVSKYDFPENRILLCPELDPTYSNLFGRYCDTSTTALHRHNMYVENIEDDPCGYIVDILPLDPIPYTEEFLCDYTHKLCICSDIINCIGNYSYRYHVKPTLFSKYMLKALRNRKKVISGLFSDLFRYDEKDCDYYAMRWGGVPLLFPKEWFQEPTEWQFEDMTAMMPTMCNAYLTMHYGDSWTNVPDISEQEGHIAVHREDISYLEFRKEYRDLLHQKKLGKVRVLAYFYKLYRLCVANKENRRRIKRLSKKGLKVIELADMENEKTLKFCDQCLEMGDDVFLDSVLGPLAKLQVSSAYIGREDFKHMRAFNYPVLIDMSDRLFEILLKYLLRINKIWAILRLLDIREKKIELTMQMKEMRADVLSFRDAVNDYDIQDYLSSYRKAEKLAKKYPNWAPLIKLRIRLFLYKDQGDTSSCRRLVEIALKLYPNDGEFLRYKYELDQSNRVGHTLEDILNINHQVMTSTRNGTIWLSVRDEMATLYPQYEEKIFTFIEKNELDTAASWVEMCNDIYLNPWAEKLELLSLYIESMRNFSGKFSEVDDANKINAKIVRRIKSRYSKARELKEDWKQLYLLSLMRIGYSEAAATAEVNLVDLKEDYEALVEGERLLCAEETEDILFPHGNYLYALGKTADAVKKYKAVLSCENVASFIKYQASERLERLRLVKEKSAGEGNLQNIVTVDSSKKEKRRKKSETLLGTVRKKLYPINVDWSIVRCVDNRDRLKNKYAKKKALILELWKNNDVIRLEKELAEFHSKMQVNLKKCDMAVIFDKEIFEIYLCVFYKSQKEKKRKEFIRKTPPKWRKEVGI